MPGTILPVVSPAVSSGTTGDELAPAEADVVAAQEEAAAREGPVAAALLYAAARISLDRLDDPATGFELLDAALARSASAPMPLLLRAFRDLSFEAGSILAVVDAIDRELKVTVVGERRAELLVERAALQADCLLLPAEARASLDEALRLVPGHRAALVIGQALAERAAEADWLRATLERRLAAAATPPERARVLTRLALLAELEPERLPQALDYFGRALDEDATGDAAAVARAGLRRVAMRLSQDVELLRGITAEAEALGPGPQRAAWLTVASAVTRHRLGAVERATTTLEHALVDEPSDLAALSLVAEDHLAAGRWRQGIELLDRQADLVADPELAAALQSLAAHVAEQNVGDDDGASRRYRRVLAVRPSDPVALQAMERIASRSGDVPLQIELLSSAVGRAEDPAERAALAVRVAELNEVGLGDLDTAVAFARRALEAIPGYGPAVQTLERLYARLGRWGDMLRVLDDEAAHEERETVPATPADDAAARRLERTGSVYENGLGDPGKAMEAYREWAGLGVRRAAALQALLRAAEKAGDALVAGEAAMKLGIELAELSTDQRVAWRYRAATLYEERAAADAEAIAALESVLELAPNFRPAFAGLARAYRRTRNWAALADVLSRRAACEASPSRAAALEVEAAHVFAESLLDNEAALQALDRALQVQPASLPALDLRVRLLLRLGRLEDAAAALATMGDNLVDPAARVAALRRQAVILEWSLRRPREALVAIERALTFGRVPGTPAVELGQERLLALVGRAGDAAALQLARLPPPSSRATDTASGSLGRRLDLAVRLPDHAQALRLLAQIVEVTSTDVFALELQAWLAHRLGDDATAAVAQERLGEVAQDAPARVAFWRAAIGARMRQGGEPAGAFELYQRIADADPNADLLSTFERLATRRADWALVVSARRALADSAGDDLARAIRLWELADARVSLGDERGATADLERARDLAPDLTPIRSSLARLQERAGATWAAAQTYVELGRRSKSRARAAQALRHGAHLFAEIVRDDEAAAKALEELLVLEPDADADFQLLENILKQRGEIGRLVEAARQRASGGPTPVRRDRLRHLADLLHHHRPAEAVEPLQAAVALDPLHIPSLLGLAELFAELGRTSEAVTTYRRAVAVARDPKIVASAWTRVGQIAAGELGDVSLSIGAFRNALAAVPDDVTALNGLGQALLRQRDFLGAADALRRLATVDADEEARVGHFVKLGEILAGPARDPEGAADALEQAQRLDPAREIIIERLDAILTDLGDPRRLAQALGRYVEANPAGIPRRLRLARLLRGPLAAPDRAAEEFRTVVELSPSDSAARAELATVLEEAGRARESVIEHLAVLRAEPLRLDSLRALRRLFGRLGDRPRTDTVVAILAALGLAEPDDARAAREARVRWRGEPHGTLAPGEFDTIVRHPSERHPATVLLSTLVEVVPRLHPINLEELGISRNDRIGPRSDDPVRSMVQRLSALFGIQEAFEVYLARTGLTQVQVEATFPPALLVPATLVVSSPHREVMLQLGRQLGRLRASTYLAGRLSARELGIILASALRSRYPDYGRGLAGEDVLQDMTQKVGRLVPRRHRRGFERAVVGVAEAGPLDVSRWRLGMAHTAHRASLLVTGDVLGCLEQVIRSDRRLAAAAAVSPSELLEAARAHQEIIEVVSFVLGDDYAALRDRLG